MRIVWNLTIQTFKSEKKYVKELGRKHQPTLFDITEGIRERGKKNMKIHQTM